MQDPLDPTVCDEPDPSGDRPHEQVAVTPVVSTDSTQYLKERLYLETLERELEEIKTERNEFAREVTELEAEVDRLEAEIASLEATIEQKDNQLAQVIANYETILERKDAKLQAAERTDSRLDLQRLFGWLS